jgi:hypothetical protein
MGVSKFKHLRREGGGWGPKFVGTRDTSSQSLTIYNYGYFSSAHAYRPETQALRMKPVAIAPGPHPLPSRNSLVKPGRAEGTGGTGLCPVRTGQRPVPLTAWESRTPPEFFVRQQARLLTEAGFFYSHLQILPVVIKMVLRFRSKWRGRPGPPIMAGRLHPRG